MGEQDNNEFSKSKDSVGLCYVIDVKGNILKMEQDCREIVEKALVESKEHFNQGDLESGLNVLLAAEKRSRLSADVESTITCMKAVLSACYMFKNYDKMNSIFTLILKRRGQLKDAVTAFVQESCAICEAIEDVHEQVRFIETISAETIGKVYVENERARLLRKLANINEQKGCLKEAANLMQELHVENYMTMSQNEKVDFMLEQLRLAYEEKNYSLAETVSAKIDQSAFKDDFVMTNKYHILMAKLRYQFRDYIDVALHYKALLDSTYVRPGTPIWKEATRAVIVIMLMAERSEKQAEEIKKMKKLKHIEDVSPYDELLTLFSTEELIDFNYVVESYKKLFVTDCLGIVCHFNPEIPEGIENWKLFETRIHEYNVYIVSLHYKNIKLTTLGRHLKLTAEEAEEVVCTLVRRDSIYAKINHPLGSVSFIKKVCDSEIINNWNISLNELLVDIKHLDDEIKKEEALMTDVYQFQKNGTEVDPVLKKAQEAFAATNT